MEQIHQHEWVTISQSVSKCKHCKCERFKYVGSGTQSIYIEYVIGKTVRKEEPTCITRSINAPQREAEK